MPAFFVPGTDDPEQAEAMWLEMKDRSPIPVTDRRIFRATCSHDLDDILVTVGEPRLLTRYKRKRSGRIDESRQPEKLRSGNTVLAIFESVHESPTGTRTLVIWETPGGSGWANPAMCGHGQVLADLDSRDG